MHDLREEANDDDLVDRFAENWRTAGLPEAILATLEFAVKLTRTPEKMQQQDIKDLRSHGYTEAEIHDIVQITSFFNYINRVADALGVPPDDGIMTPWLREEGDW